MQRALRISSGLRARLCASHAAGPSKSPVATPLRHLATVSSATSSTSRPPPSAIVQGPPRPPLSAASTGEADDDLAKYAKSFEAAGLNPRLSLQLVRAIPSIRTPTKAQQALLPAIAGESDIILRAHTGTGKSFGLLLALLNKPRLVVKQLDKSASLGDKRITSIVVVPSKELALQYERWAKQLFPRNFHDRLSSIVAVKYRDRSISTEEHLKALSKAPPHVLVVTATLLQDMLDSKSGPFVLSIATLRTLVLDEGDALLELPSRFPSQKLVWNHLKHPPAGLRVLNTFMRSRSTLSGGDPVPSAGIELGDKSAKSETRRKLHQGNDLMRERAGSADLTQRKSSSLQYSPAKPRIRGEKPLQLIVVSATANSVMRHFLGAKTGWLRTGIIDERRHESGKWLDLTGLSAGVGKGKEVQGMAELSQSGWPLQLPKELKHSCVVVDEPTGDPQEQEYWRGLHAAIARQARQEAAEDMNEEEIASTEQEDGVGSSARDGPLIVAPTTSPSASFDELLLTCLAFLCASQPVQSGLVLIPATWSLAKTRAFLSQLEVPVRLLLDGLANSSGNPDEATLYLAQANAIRGIDVPGGVSHVFCLGIDAVKDASNYTHIAGRAARYGLDSEGRHERPPGHVITVIRGVSASEARQNRKAGKEIVLSSSELKMSLIYQRLSLKAHRLSSLKYSDLEELEEIDEEPPGSIERRSQREAEARLVQSGT